MTIDALPHWDLSNVYPSLQSDEFKQAVGQLRLQAEDLDQYLVTHRIFREGRVFQDPAELAQTIAGYLDRMNGLLRLGFTLSFYNFPYAFGLLFGLGLYAIYQKRGKAFLPEYDELSRCTGEGTAADLAARFGIDIRQRAFWDASLSIIAVRIERYRAL